MEGGWLSVIVKGSGEWAGRVRSALKINAKERPEDKGFKAVKELEKGNGEKGPGQSWFLTREEDTIFWKFSSRPRFPQCGSWKPDRGSESIARCSLFTSVLQSMATRWRRKVTGSSKDELFLSP